jgi:hypothetical protein
MYLTYHALAPFAYHAINIRRELPTWLLETSRDQQDAPIPSWQRYVTQLSSYLFPSSIVPGRPYVIE